MPAPEDYYNPGAAHPMAARHLHYCPGPTNCRQNVLQARAQHMGNPDVDPEFTPYYVSVCQKLQALLGTRNDVHILSGEGMVGLDAAICSLTEPGDRLLVISNGIFGAGFADMAKTYGGQPDVLSFDERRPIDPAAVEEYLNEHSGYKYATLVHCDTPSGVVNSVEHICPLLKRKGILTVVDTVAGMIGETFLADAWGVDVALGGSQKALSAPIGLSFLSISPAAWKAMEERKTPIPSFYCNLLTFKSVVQDQWFPYSMPVHDIAALEVAADNVLEEGLERVVERHARIAGAIRSVLQKNGIELFLEAGHGNTCTAFIPPPPISCDQLLETLRTKFSVTLSGSFGHLKGKVVRIGHMGENAHLEVSCRAMHLLGLALASLGFPCADMGAQLIEALGAPEGVSVSGKEGISA